MGNFNPGDVQEWGTSTEEGENVAINLSHIRRNREFLSLTKEGKVRRKGEGGGGDPPEISKRKGNQSEYFVVSSYLSGINNRNNETNKHFCHKLPEFHY